MPGVSPEEQAGLRRHHVPGTFGEGGLGPMWGGLCVTTSHWVGGSRGSGPPGMFPPGSGEYSLQLRKTL